MDRKIQNGTGLILPAQLILATESGHQYSPYLIEQFDRALPLTVHPGPSNRVFNIDEAVKSPIATGDGLWKKVDIRGVEFEMAIW